MALTQEQVDWWFAQNPEATADDVAAAVQAAGGLEANEGLAGMIASRYAIAEPEVTNYYKAYTAPKVDTPTFTDTILAGTPTTEDELLAALSDNTSTVTGATGVDTVVGAAGNDTVVGGTGTTQTQAVTDPFAAWLAANPTGVASSDSTADTGSVSTVDAGSGFTDPFAAWLAANPTTLTDATTFDTSTTQDDLISNLADNITDTTAEADTTGNTDSITIAGTDTTDADTISVADKLLGQILAQGTTGQWTGEGFGSVAANAENMAQLLADIGITDISQFGVLPVYADVQEIGKTYNGQYVRTFTNEDGTTTSGIYKGTGQYDQDGNETQIFVEVPADAKLETLYGRDNGMGELEAIDQSKLKTVDGKLVVDTGQTTYGNTVTGQAVGNTYAERQTENAFGGTFLGEGNTGYRVKFDAKGNPIFYTTYSTSSDIADWGPILQLAAVIPSPIQPFAIAANAAIAIENNDILGGIAALAGLAGYSDVAAGARILKAVDSKDPFAIVSSIMNSPFGGDIGGTMLTDTISLMDVGNALNVAKNISDENYAGALTSLGQLTGSSDVKTAAAAARVIKAISSNNPANIVTAMAGLDRVTAAASKVTDKNVALNITNTLAAANSAATEGTQLASLATDTVSDAGNGFTIKGDGGSTLNFPDFTGSDSINADAALFDSSVGDLDAAATDTTTGNITDTTGLDMGDVIPDTGDGVEELVVTGTDTTGLDMGDVIPDSGTDTVVVDDKGEVVVTGTPESCPVGTVLNPVTGDCDPYWDEGTGDDVVVDDKGEVVITAKPESCPVGTVLNPETGECDAVEDKGEVVITDKKDSCPVGTVLNLETGECDAVEDKGEVVITDKKESCPVGTVLNPETGECDPVDEPLTCPPGKVPNEAGTACIDETVIIGKPESCPVGTTLNLETGECDPIDEPLTCPPGKVLNEAGTACIDETVIIGKPESCPVGTVLNRETGECDPIDEPLTCPPGKVLNEAGTACIDEVVITATPESCQVGTLLNPETGECDPVDDETPCADGFHRDEATGLCVPDDDEEPKECPEGYVRNLETGVCEKAETECPSGQVKNADGKCVPVTQPPKPCPTGYERVNGACVPICQPGYMRIDGVCKKIPTEVSTTMPVSGFAASGEKTDPIYAGGMDDFNLLATLQELLAEEPPKKDDKKSKDKTKMATGGHLDDLLAEQMTVDDLLKLLR